MESPHNVEAWIAEVAGRPSVFNHNVRLSGSEFRGFELVNEVELTGSIGLPERVYIYARRTGEREALLRVSLSEQDDTRYGLLTLRDDLDHSMRPDPARSAGKLAKLIDVGFAQRDESGAGMGAVSFTVGNVAVTLRSAGDEPVDVAAAAAQLAKMLAGPPDKASLKSGLARARKPARVDLKAGQAGTVIDALPDPVPSGVRVQLFAPDGEFRRQGNTLIYTACSDGKARIERYEYASN
jgi:hypothetical protein